ncbi:MAG: LptF/LptG family permease [Sulfurovum sp.]|jgi:lipopolysaccharide export system permease protein|uniref:LptF/LptG family permease n=1 Tax=Sulfurovum sp. TaxID=1969726 RepID=UPI003C72D91B
MVNVKGYISSNFTRSFLTIFLPFFIIISLVFLVRIAALTSKIQIDFGELLLLYSYSIPEIVFYTLPLSFIAALANVLVNLSQGNELIALYALGLKSKKILSGLLLIGLLFSLLLTTISLLAMPLSKQFYRAFKEEKRNDAKLNIVPGELGQKFGSYYIYVKDKTEDTFQNIVIYNRTDKTNEQFFSSHTGKLNRNEDVTSLLLNDGYGYTYSEIKLQQAEYKTLEIFDNAKKKGFEFKSILSYWQEAQHNSKIMHKLLFFIFVSLIPVLSVYLVASFTMINPRYQPNRSFTVIFVSTLFFYAIASSLQKWGTLPILGISVIVIMILGQWLFKKRVSKYF